MAFQICSGALLLNQVSSRSVEVEAQSREEMATLQRNPAAARAMLWHNASPIVPLRVRQADMTADPTGVLGFEGKRILVTGATGGLGSRVCSIVGQSGGEAIVVARDRHSAADLEERVNGRPADYPRVFPVDFSNTERTRACATALEQSNLPFDGLVLIPPGVPKSEEVWPSDTAWRAALDLCFINPLCLLTAASKNLIDGGRIVVVSGIATVEVFPSLPFTNVVRLAWLAECKRLSFALGPRRIRVNTVSLGGTLTEQFAARLARRLPHDIPERDSPESIPLGEFGDPDDAAYVVALLLSRLANHVTGTNVVFDGGLSRGY